MNSRLFSYIRQNASGNSCTNQAWAQLPEPLDPDQRAALKSHAAHLLRKHHAVLVAHYYVDGDLQDLALESGGCVADSLEMARFGRDHVAQTLVVAGVRFMGESAKILSPYKKVLMPDLDATCSLDLGCQAVDFAQFCDAYPDRQVVVYANTSAAVKARADWMVTSSCALGIVRSLKEQGHKILWAPDRHLGRYIQEETGADMLLCEGACIVHEEFKGEELAALKAQYPEAMVLVHPESPRSVVVQADVVGSTAQMLQAVVNGAAQIYIVATDNLIMHRMRQLAPGKTLIEAPTAGHAASCKSCAHCPWMAMNSLQGLVHCLENNTGEVILDSALGMKAKTCIDRMLDFVQKHPETLAPKVQGFVRGIGAV